MNAAAKALAPALAVGWCVFLLAAQQPSRPSPSPASAYRLYAAVLNSRGYVVGAKLPPSGLFAFDPNPAARRDPWLQLGFNHPHIEAIDFHPRQPNILYLAAGNGCMRSDNGGRSWRIVTGWEITEPLDVSVDANRPDDVYLALPDGVYVTRDGGRAWSRFEEGLGPRKFTKAIQTDRARARRVIAGGDQGIYLSEDGNAWRRTSADGLMITHLAQSPHNAADWLACTQRGGLLRSADGGLSWTALSGVPADRTLYNAAFDPTTPGRIAVATWGPGVLVSENDGRVFSARNVGLPEPHIWRVAFHPKEKGMLYASVHEQRLYVSPDAGGAWRSAGLEGSLVRDLVFVPTIGASK